MPAKIAEKRLFAGVALFVLSVLLLFNTTLINTPIRVPEKGMALVLIAVILLILSVRLISKSKISV